MIENIPSKSNIRQSCLWKNNKYGAICDIENDYRFRFIEVIEEGQKYRYSIREHTILCPIVAQGLIAWWIKLRRNDSIRTIFDKYYRECYSIYETERSKQANSWNCDIEEEFLRTFIEWGESVEIDFCRPLFDYISDDETQTIRDIIKEYYKYLNSKYKEKFPRNAAKGSESNKEEKLQELEFIILDLLSIHGKEIGPSIKPEKQIYDYEELRLYGEKEITKCSLQMMDKEWIYCFCDEGPAYWHRLEDKGRQVLRKYYEDHPERFIIRGSKCDSKNEPYTDSNGFELPLPGEINTNRAQKYFKRAIDLGYMSFDGNKFEWIGIGKRGSTSQLAYFCGLVYNYRYSIQGNKGESFPEDYLNHLFNVNRLRTLLDQVYRSQIPQRWRKKIDEIFDE